MGDGENPHKKREADGLLGWLALPSAWYRRSIRTAANIIATTCYGEAALSREFTSRTVAGLAIYRVLYGIVGALCGPGRYYLPFAILWRNINPLIPLYTHGGPLMAGHALYGGFPGYPHNAG